MKRCSPTVEDLAPGQFVHVPLLDDPKSGSRPSTKKTSQVSIYTVRADDNEVDVLFKGDIRTIPYSDVDFGWRCTDHLFNTAKTHGKKHFPGKVITKDEEEDKSPVFRGNEASREYVTNFLVRKDVAQQHLESNWKPKNSKVKWRLLQTPYKLYWRLRAEMIEHSLTPVSWTFFWKIVCRSGKYEVLTADNCCCATCRDLGFYNFNEYRKLVKDLMSAKVSVANTLFAQAKKDPAYDKLQLQQEISNFKEDIGKAESALLNRIDKQVS
jgi:hypothetical protein